MNVIGLHRRDLFWGTDKERRKNIVRKEKKGERGGGGEEILNEGWKKEGKRNGGSIGRVQSSK
ncbi:hypothetical protein [Nonomuraea dietziae]|uniref:hypothetical protein n=1 Tax=Nonomuraea dietziae TaxID=65515 RepID=UPI0031E0D319